MSAEVYAAKHSVTRYHRVNVWEGERLIRVVGDQRAQLALTDDPPF